MRKDKRLARLWNKASKHLDWEGFDMWLAMMYGRFEGLAYCDRAINDEDLDRWEKSLDEEIKKIKKEGQSGRKTKN